MEKIMDPNLIDYYMIDSLIPSKIRVQYRYQINFGNLGGVFLASIKLVMCFELLCVAKCSIFS